ncbi:MAG: acetyl-CoA hydrolase/transferase family protein, partial [Magnetococcales bacterium]|nr:acetyl-CoA hydrolase/transferase family protein [Magnetococcales bacterium]
MSPKLPPEITAKLWKEFVKPGDRMFIGSNAAAPIALAQHFLENSKGLRDVEIVHILTLGDQPWTAPEYQDRLRVNALFLGKGAREAVRRGDADYTPCFLSEIPSLFVDGVLPLDVALVMVSPPDRHGFCSLGVAVDIVSAACRSARIVLAQINPAMPRTFGNSFIHISRIAACLPKESPLPELEPAKMDDETRRIGEYVALLVEDGATLQMGIGKIPDAVLSNLGDRNDLGVHTEMFSDGVIDLIESGVINNRRKLLHPGKTVATFCMGSRRLYDFVHENPHIEFHPSEYVNSPVTIARNERQISINSAIEVDLTGQVVADSVGYRFYSGIGGQVDFIRGAAMSKGGRPIIALPSTAKGGKLSRIVPHLTEGGGVVTSRGDVHYVVTEYGIATLRGKSIRERALELIQVAHPDFRDWLLEKVRQQYWVSAWQPARSRPVKELGDVEQVKLRYKHAEYFLRPLHPSDEHRVKEFLYSLRKDVLTQPQESVVLAPLPSDSADPSLANADAPTASAEEGGTPVGEAPGMLVNTCDRAHPLVNIDQSRDLALCIVE